MDNLTRYSRQYDIVMPELLNERINIIGCGGIGSWTAFLLAKMGCQNIFVYDDDIVEDHNIASQFFKESDIGQLKRDALKASILEQTGIEIVGQENKNEEVIDRGLVIFAIDSMRERIRLAQIFQDKDIYIIDGRMGGLQMEIYSYPIKEYMKTLVNPDEADHDACTAKAICFNCAIIGGFMSNYIRDFVTTGELKNQEIILDFKNLVFIKSTQDTISNDNEIIN
jgi:molybdopterin/thiamine biosynthesis adenylyltransferase